MFDPTEREEPYKVVSLSMFDAALLALIREEGAAGMTGYEIEQRIEEGDAGLLGHSASAVYGRLPKLAAAELLSSEPVPGRRGRQAKRYNLTRVGMDSLSAWFGTKIKLPPLDESQLFVRIRAARGESNARAWHGFHDLMWQIDDKGAWLNYLERQARESGTWLTLSRKYEILLMRKQLKAYHEWADELRRDLGGKDPVTDNPAGAYHQDDDHLDD